MVARAAVYRSVAPVLVPIRAAASLWELAWRLLWLPGCVSGWPTRASERAALLWLVWEPAVVLQCALRRERPLLGPGCVPCCCGRRLGALTAPPLKRPLAQGGAGDLAVRMCVNNVVCSKAVASGACAL